MRLRATADLHIRPGTWPWVRAALLELLDDAREHGGPTVLVGDVFEQVEQLDGAVLLALRDLLRGFRDGVWVLVGNHDQLPDGSSPLKLLEDRSRVWVVDEPAFVPGLGPLIPHRRSPEEFRDAVEAACAQDEGGALLWAHQGFRGAYMNRMTRDRTGIPVRSLPGSRVVVAGHYHCPQNLGSLVYCGSPYEVSFAEEGQAKGWLLWEDAAERHFPERVPFGNLGAPRHFTLWWDPEVGAPEIPQEYRQGDRLRIKTKIRRSDADRAADQLAKGGLSGVPVDATPDDAVGRGVVSLDQTARDAAVDYAVRVYGPRGIDVGALIEAAEREGLWDGC